MKQKDTKTSNINYKEWFMTDIDNHDDNIVVYDAVESMDSADIFDNVSKGTANKITDSATAVIYEERANRVVGQLPKGKTVAIGKMSAGKAMFLDLLKEKWIYPNANADFDLRTKLEMWVENSSKYGKVMMYPDIVVDENGDTHLDCFLIHPRNFIPEKGKISIKSMRRCHMVTFQDKDWFEELLDTDAGWDKEEIRRVIARISEKATTSDPKRQSRSKHKSTGGDQPGIKVVTTYTAGKKGRWVTFLPEYGHCVIRDIENPHKNSKLPFIQKPNRIKMDNYYETSDYIRSMPMQALSDGLDNYYVKGLQRALYPPVAINGTTVVRQSMSNDSNAIWEFNGTPEFRTVDGSTAGLNTYSTVKGMTKGAINSLAGTTDTAITAESSANPAYGRTPQALQMLEKRESVGDAKSRALLESAFSELTEYWYSLLPLVVDSIPVDLIEDDILKIVDEYPEFADVLEYYVSQGDITTKMSKPIVTPKIDENGVIIADEYGRAEQKELESGKSITIKIRPSMFKDLKITYNVDFNSSFKKTKEGQLAALNEYTAFLGKIPNALQEYRLATGRVLNWDKLMKTVANLMEIDIADELFIDAPIQPQAPTQVQPQVQPQAPTGQFSDPMINQIANELGGMSAN